MSVGQGTTVGVEVVDIESVEVGGRGGLPVLNGTPTEGFKKTSEFFSTLLLSVSCRNHENRLGDHFFLFLV
jgi:hypothetical protein